MPFQWNDHQGVDEVMHKLVCANMELQSAKSEANEEIRRNKETIRQLVQMIKSVCRERDEARDKLQLLLTGFHNNKNVSALRPEPSNYLGLPSGCDLESEILEKLGTAKPLPEKGRLMQAVVEAGPLLQSLLIGPIPKWRNPPPLQLGKAVGLPFHGGLVGESSLASPSSVLNVGRACLNGEGVLFSDGGIRRYQVATGKRRMIQ